MPKTYNTILLFLFATIGVILFTSLAMNEPVNGDLTRIGGYRETEYGWNEPQEEFEQDVFQVAHHITEYDQYYDVVVLGDSFSFSNKTTWVNYFVEKTGYSVLVIHFSTADIDKILRSPQFLATPPRMLIYESVERLFISRLLKLGLSSAVEFSNHDFQNPDLGFTFHPIKTGKHLVHRAKTWANLETGLSDAASYIQRTFWQYEEVDHALQDEQVELTLRLKMKATGQGKFSSANQRDILILKEDITAKKYTDDQIAEAGRIIHEIHHAAVANGQTHFSTLIFPDKLTVYEDYLEDERWRGLSVINRLNRHYNLLRLDTLYKDAVHNIMVDLYIPNNTHTSSKGNKIAADRLMEFLENNPLCQAPMP